MFELQKLFYLNLSRQKMNCAYKTQINDEQIKLLSCCCLENTKISKDYTKC